MKYRDRLEIIYSMLKPMEGSPTNRTRMMSNGSTSYKNFKQYFELMTEHGLVEKRNLYDKPVGLSERGIRFIRVYEELMALFNEKNQE